MNEQGLDLRRLILIGAGLPLVAAGATYLLMYRFVVGHRSVLESTLGFGCFVLEIGLVGFAVGKAMPHPPFRWILFAWLLLLVNLIVGSMAMVSSYSYLSEILPAAALVAGEIGLAIIWGTLGTGRWYWRAPLTIGLGGGLLLCWISWVTGSNGQLLTEVLIIQSITLGLFSGALWLRGYRLAMPEPQKEGGNGPRSLQFGIRDVLIWTTVAAVLLGLLRAADMLRWSVIRERPSIIFAGTVAILSAMAIVFAMWAALGKGHWLLRFPLLILVLLGLGTSLGAFCRYGERTLQARGWSLGAYDWDLHTWLGVGWWWIAWMFLSGGLLTASLMIFRATGYRLVRRQSAPRASR